MITLVLDSNALRNPGLDAYLAASRDHAVAFSDLTLVEMRKTNAIGTSRASLQIVSRYPLQRYVLRRTDLMLDERITNAEQAAALFDEQAAMELDSLCDALRTLPVPAELASELAKDERDAKLIMERLTVEVAELEPGMIDAAKEFTTAELTQIRLGEGVTDATRRKLLDLLKETIGLFILRNQEPGRRTPMKLVDTFGMFAFRYSLCTLLYYMEWVRTGRTGKALDKRVNDVIDMQVAAMGTYFNGVLSTDKFLRTTSMSARTLLRSFGAYVGDDWPPGVAAAPDSAD